VQEHLLEGNIVDQPEDCNLAGPDTLARAVDMLLVVDYNLREDNSQEGTGLEGHWAIPMGAQQAVERTDR
jgi:hypothetical protein